MTSSPASEENDPCVLKHPTEEDDSISELSLDLLMLMKCLIFKDKRVYFQPQTESCNIVALQKYCPCLTIKADLLDF